MYNILRFILKFNYTIQSTVNDKSIIIPVKMLKRKGEKRNQASTYVYHFSSFRVRSFDLFRPILVLLELFEKFK